MSKYETTLILDPGLEEARVAEETDRVQQWIRTNGGEVLEVQQWGKRRLAYEIRRKRDGIYIWILHEGGGPLVGELERQMRLNESVLRGLTVLHVPPELTQGRPIDAAGEEGDGEE